MPPRQNRVPSRAALLAGAALCALTTGAAAKDLPATPEGAQKLNAFFSTYIGAAAAGAPPTFTITPEGSDYLVALDVAALAAPLKSAGVAYDPATLKYKLIEQDDGAWRLESADLPPLSLQTPKGSSKVAVTGYKSQMVVDPAIAWWRSASGSADKASLHSHVEAGIDESIDTGAVQFSGSGEAAAEGAVSSAVQESAADVGFSFTGTPKSDQAGADPKTISIGAHLDKATVEASVDGVKPRRALDLWAFLVAHPTRDSLAANEPALKGLLSAMAANPLRLSETIGLQKIAVQIAQGSVVVDSAKVRVGGATGAPGAFEEHIAFDGLSLPPGIVPPLYRDLTPTSADIGFRASGFDVAAASAEAIADLRLAGDGPPLPPEARAKIWAKLVGAGPVTIEVPLSHIAAPRVDISIEGRVRYQDGRPTGSFTVHMRDFDNTITALKGLGPAVERKIVPMLGLAKGLAKTEGDGALTWVGEIGADGVMKVNGLPLGKAPL